MTRIEFKHGPVTITVTGLPDCVPADAFRLALSIHSPVLLSERERVAGFSEAFTALGGVETFAGTDPAAPFSVVSAVARAGFSSELLLFPPGCSGDDALAFSAIVTALDVDRHARDVRNELAAIDGAREAAQQVAGVLRGVGERGSVQDAVDAERSHPVRPRQGGMPVAPECERGCVCDQACGAFDPCERLRP